MNFLHPSMRLKAAGGTFFLPDRNGGVYVRNHAGSFRMQGEQVQTWLERLMPLFNGEHTLADLLESLPEPHQKRICEIAAVLYENGIVRDVNEDLEHQLPESVLQTYAGQIEFLEVMGRSGARRFQEFREARVLAVGAGTFLTALAGALMQAGLRETQVLFTDSEPVSRTRLAELVAHAQASDPETALREVSVPLAEAVAEADWILYATRDGEAESVLALEAICRQQGKTFLPAVFVEQAGMAGPMVHPGFAISWESAWRRLHAEEVRRDPTLHAPSSVAEALLANVLVLELMKTAGGVSEFVRAQEFFLLNLETLEGGWHGFVPHPCGGTAEVRPFADLGARVQEAAPEREPASWFYAFHQLTSPVCGVFHVWEEGELEQLPMAQCRVQAVDPRSAGLAGLLPSRVCIGLTHEEARLESGLVGLEEYVRASVAGADLAHGFLGVGAGLTMAEAVGRALQKCLEEELGDRQREGALCARSVSLLTVVDQRCQFEMQALAIANGAPRIGAGPEVCGFPTVFVETGGHEFWGIGLNGTLALRMALESALQHTVLKTAGEQEPPLAAPVKSDEEEPQSLVFPGCVAGFTPELVCHALDVLAAQGKRVEAFDLAQESFLRHVVAEVVGVVLREEEST
ncbi:hypothetical protein [Tumebacillus flagellatus]|uniref:Thiazole-containing bacteriocin maturation protein n=1 Tax=Tumebacillus flagellatus TaxID=1157490 RepID=A0A074MD06_9BACL|nr:hypothetical protein [Tumebacillus flagellatus]KEO83762.1 hypothetical protein EL26_07535 [Tumebacillus flagellatus]